MTSLWTEGADVVAWTEHDGPDVGPEPAAPIWTRGLAAGWAVFMIPILGFSCVVLAAAAATECPSIPRWVSWTSLGFACTLLVALSGLMSRATRGAEWSIYAAILGGISSAPDLTYAPQWAVFELASFTLLGVWAAIAHTKCRAVDLARQHDEWDIALVEELSVHQVRAPVLS